METIFQAKIKLEKGLNSQNNKGRLPQIELDLYFIIYFCV